MESFDDILTSLLKSVESAPSSNVDEVIASKMKEFGLSEEGQKILDETNSYLVAFHEAYHELQDAKKRGETGNSWMQGKLIGIAQKHELSDEQTEKLVEDIAEVCKEGFDTTFEGFETTLKEGE